MKVSRNIAAALFCVICANPGLGTAGEVGVFLAEQPSCKITGAGASRPCRKDAAISEGDLIATGAKASSLPIQWLAPGLVRLDPVAPGRYRVAYTPPPQPAGVLAVLGDLVGFARKAGRISHRAVTRGAASHPLLPGATATLLPGQRFSFSWCTPAVQQLLITREDGAPFRQVAVAAGTRTLSLLPEELGLEPGVTYRWQPVGTSGEGGTIRLLQAPAAGVITDVLAGISQAEGSALEKVLRQAVFVQFLAENYGPDYSLGWLQYQLLVALPAVLTPEDRAAVERLKEQCGLAFCP